MTRSFRQVKKKKTTARKVLSKKKMKIKKKRRSRLPANPSLHLRTKRKESMAKV